MPKTEAEKRTLSTFSSEYGDDKGKQVYYALRNKNKKFDRSQGGGFKDKKSKKAKAQWWLERMDKLSEVMKSRILEFVSQDPELTWWIHRMQAVNKAQKEGHTR